MEWDYDDYGDAGDAAMMYDDAAMYDDDDNDVEGYFPEDAYLMEEEYLRYAIPHDPHQALNFSEVLDQCVRSSLTDAFRFTFPLIGLCLTLYVSSLMGQGFDAYIHIVAIVCGMSGLYYFFHYNMVYIVFLSVLGYLALVFGDRWLPQGRGIRVAAICALYLITCELYVAEATTWHQVRGAQMIMVMKLVSLAFDVDHGTVGAPPGTLEYAGYMYNAGTVVFGPWISFREYKRITCVIFPIGQLEASKIIPDRQCTVARERRGAICCFYVGHCREMAVARPYHVELPRSLVEVVTNWNVPMHNWLKTYVFKTTRPLGTFAAVLLTYAASSLLHGLNFQLSAVLLSLGFYSYIEHVLREKLSRYFDACVLARKCKPDCRHANKQQDPRVFLVNLGFTVISVWHLAYLGLMFDSSSEVEEKVSHSDKSLVV
ncbi:PREDICTED: protein-serine O-palmitoleoyltransferase porcupine-like [Priapulus caudatus]|uniref:Protein-serine O-palmitoleoyltransferase porcupine n=1 Tax=Priapulus caudatus TaxID=37621 RepID=A0ABM1EM05_PRICU|nr:PREDICTED: protein-serine O-palmitoleoyltransferase porcupine-like [Priapulus caudatus]